MTVQPVEFVKVEAQGCEASMSSDKGVLVSSKPTLSFGGSTIESL